MNRQEKDIREIISGRKMNRFSLNKRRDSAVLIPLVEKDGRLDVLFEVRNQKIRQGGEVCFPGGRIEEGESARHTAVRETSEELLLPEDKVEVLGPMYSSTGPGGAEVRSYVGLLHDYHDTFRLSEVDHVFRLPLQWLLDYSPEIHEADMVISPRSDFPFDLIEKNGQPYPFQKITRNYYFFKTEFGVIWGFTAELLYQFLETVRTSSLWGERLEKTQEDR